MSEKELAQCFKEGYEKVNDLKKEISSVEQEISQLEEKRYYLKETLEKLKNEICQGICQTMFEETKPIQKIK